MNYKPGQKVKVSVNGAEWEDEISFCFAAPSSECGDLIDQVRLKSGFSAPVSALTPIEPEIKPEPGDIVSVWDTTYEDEPKHPWFFREFVKMGDYRYGVLDEHGNGNAYYWSGCRVIARKPKRWEELDDEDCRRFVSWLAQWNFAVSRRDEGELYDSIVSLILGGIPYARIDK